MLKHIIMFKFKDSFEGRTGAENAAKAAEMSKGLVGKIPELRESATHLNCVASPINYDLVIELSFDDAAGMGAFHVHPLHMELVKFADAATDSISAVDYEY